MKKVIILAAIAMMAACEKDQKPPPVDNAFHPVVDGKALTPFQYKQTYCLNPKFQKELVCRRVSAAHTYVGQLGKSENDPFVKREFLKEFGVEK